MGAAPTPRTAPDKAAGGLRGARSTGHSWASSQQPACILLLPYSLLPPGLRPLPSALPKFLSLNTPSLSLPSCSFGSVGTWLNTCTPVSPLPCKCGQPRNLSRVQRALLSSSPKPPTGHLQEGKLQSRKSTCPKGNLTPSPQTSLPLGFCPGGSVSCPYWSTSDSF